MSVNNRDQRSTCKPLRSTEPPTQPMQHAPAPAAHHSCPFVKSEGYMEKLDSQLLMQAAVCCSEGVFWPSWYSVPAGPLSQGVVWGRAPLGQGDAPGCGAGVGEAEGRHLGGLAKYRLKGFDCSINPGNGRGCQDSPGSGVTWLSLQLL